MTEDSRDVTPEETTPEETTPEETPSDEERRDFLRKVATAAGALAAVGVAAGALSDEAEAQPGGRAQVLRGTPLQYQRAGAGHTFRLQGPEIAAILAREGLIPQNEAGNANVGIAIRIGSQLAKP